MEYYEYLSFIVKIYKKNYFVQLFGIIRAELEHYVYACIKGIKSRSGILGTPLQYYVHDFGIVITELDCYVHIFEKAI